jgi:hypothetical protein
MVGEPECLRVIFRLPIDRSGSICIFAAAHGQLACLRMAWELGDPLTQLAAMRAAEKGRAAEKSGLMTRLRNFACCLRYGYGHCQPLTYLVLGATRHVQPEGPCESDNVGRCRPLCPNGMKNRHTLSI